jgi:hypothetical protein
MATFNKLRSKGTFGETVDTINENFATLSIAIGELEFSTRSAKGFFLSIEALGAAVPKPVVGDWALVQSNDASDDRPFLYYCKAAGAWTCNGERYEGDVRALNDYVKLSDFQRVDEALDDLYEKYDDLSDASVEAKDGTDEDITLGGVVLRQMTTTQFAELVGGSEPNTLYAVTEETTQTL